MFHEHNLVNQLNTWPVAYHYFPGLTGEITVQFSYSLWWTETCCNLS